MNILVIDVGGTHVKLLASGKKVKREIESGPTLTARQMVSSVKNLADGWEYDVVSIGYPGPVVHDRPIAEPHNLGKGWMGFNFAAAFKLPTKVINDAAMQALGSYAGRTMLFLGLGTGLGTWTWQVRDPVLGVVSMGNPPSGAAGGYGFFDAAGLLLAPRIVALLARRQRREDLVVQQPVRAHHTAAVGTADA